MAAFYWMLISTLTIGYGDITAVTPLEQAAVVAAVIAGVLFIGYAIKGITDVMAEAAVQVGVGWEGACDSTCGSTSGCCAGGSTAGRA
jgi:hypothetical protein